MKYKNTLFLLTYLILSIILNLQVTTQAFDLKKDKEMIGSETTGVAGVTVASSPQMRSVSGKKKYFYNCNSEKCKSLKDEIEKTESSLTSNQDECTKLIKKVKDNNIPELINEVDQLVNNIKTVKSTDIKQYQLKLAIKINEIVDHAGEANPQISELNKKIQEDEKRIHSLENELQLEYTKDEIIGSPAENK